MKYSVCVAVLAFGGLKTVSAYADTKDASVADLLVNASSANRIKVKGVVTDANGQPLVGASVTQKGTTNATMTDADGSYSLLLPANATIQITYMGYQTRMLSVNGRTHLPVVLQENAHKLTDVVVTALGMKREVKSLGYAMQELKGTTLLKTREPNITNALSGKVAGLQIIRSSNGVGGSSKIVLRGNKSLSGNNQPLIVVDGIPMDNFVGGVDDMYGNSGPDMGNGLADIDPDNIASMSVLKGASAAALYGARAGNGVILITTKTGKANKGLGITVNLGLSAETMFLKPHMQNQFGQGNLGRFDKGSNSSWGAPLDGHDVMTSDGIPSAYRAYDNIDNFFQTGVSYNEGVSFQQQIKGTSVFASVNRQDLQGITPSQNLNRTNILVRGTTSLDEAKKWTVDVKANYINEGAHNRPIEGINQSNVYTTIYNLPRSVNILNYRNCMDQAGAMTWYDKGNTPQENPYFTNQYNLHDDGRNRMIGTISLDYKPLPWLEAKVYAGTDFYTTKADAKRHAGAPSAPTGQYSRSTESFYENNFNFLATAHKDNLIGHLSASLSIGGTLMFQGRSKMNVNVGDLAVPNLFYVNNGKIIPTIETTDMRRQMNSLYGMGQLNWDNYIYLDITGRNDWSSTMSKINQSFFYPSLSLSYILSDMLKRYKIDMPSGINFVKLRGSFAEVGNDLTPYQLYNYYGVNKDAKGHTMAGVSDYTQYNSQLRSELIKSWEAGFDIRFLNNRLDLDAAWYKTNSTRQLLDIPVDPFTGYKNKKINAGNIQNEGIEATLRADIIKNPKGFNWDMSANFTMNRNSIVDLAPGIDQYTMLDAQSVRIVAQNGGGYGDIYGQQFLRVTDKNSPYYGNIVVNEDGKPEFTPDRQYLGNQNPDWMLGITSNFSYKGFDFSFLIDARVGGEIFSGTDAILHKNGVAAGTVVNGRRDDFVVPNSVIWDAGKNTYVPNNKAITVQDYWQDLASADGNFGLGEQYIYNATNVRLRNISIGYEFDKKLLHQTPFQRLRISATCNNVWMIYNHLPGIDPESAAATNSNASGFENLAAPTTRSFVFNITVGF